MINVQRHCELPAAEHDGELPQSGFSKRRDQTAALNFLSKAVKWLGPDSMLVSGEVRSTNLPFRATFGPGSGIAGIAGVAIGLFAKITSELGTDYIVQSFMTVMVGSVGNIWGALAGATRIGSLQRAIEWLNPSNTLAAQTYMILFIFLFIQVRPRDIIALKGRAAGD